MPFWKRKKKVTKDAALGEDRDAFLEALQSRLDNVDEGYRYDDDLFAMFCEGSGGVHFLKNAYDEYVANAATDRGVFLDSVVQRIRTPFPSIPDAWEDARANLMPRLRDQAYYTSARMQLARMHPGAKLPTFCKRAFAPNLALEAVYDLPTQMMAVSDDMLPKWGVSVDDLIEAALKNLAVRTGDFDVLAPGFYAYSSGDAYDSSRMALIDRIRALPVEGPHLAVAPHRDVLFVTGAADLTNRARLLQAVQQNLEAPRLQVFTPFVLGADGWQAWTPADDDPLASEWKMLDVQFNGRNYGDLRSQVEQSEEAFLAKYNAIKTGEGEILTYCVWPPEAGGWLPRTDLVSVLDYDNPTEPTMVPWEQVEHQLRRVPDVYPPVFEALCNANGEFVASLLG